jgi:2-dehydropantoate 2-reductase
MRIAFLGAGALGTTFGAIMTREGLPVDLIDASVEQVNALKSKGATIVGAIEMVQPVSALTPEEMTGTYDLVFLLTKQTANHAALPNLLKHLHPESIVCTLQNGLPEESVASYVGKEKVIGGVVAPACALVEPGVARANSSLEVMRQFAFELGEINGQITGRLKKVAKCLELVGKVDILDNLTGVRWSKLKINCSGAGLSAALNTTLGQNIDTPEGLICLAGLADEVVHTAQAQNIKLVHMQGFDISLFRLSGPQDIQRVVPMLKTIWERHRPGRGSMMNDLSRGLKSEIDYINGVVVNKGRELGIATPFNELVVEMVHEAEAGKRLNDPAMISRFGPLIEKFAPGLRGTLSV